MGNKVDVSDFECGMLVGAGGAGLNFSDAADLLRFLGTNLLGLL